DFDIVLSSTDGVTWVQRQARTSGDLDGVAYGNGRFVATDLYGDVLTSIDGIIWDRVPKVSQSLYGVTYAGGQFWITEGSGNGILLNSSDGVKWTRHQVGVPESFRVASGNGQLVAVGAGGTI